MIDANKHILTRNKSTKTAIPWKISNSATYQKRKGGYKLRIRYNKNEFHQFKQ